MKMKSQQKIFLLIFIHSIYIEYIPISISPKIRITRAKVQPCFHIWNIQNQS